MVNMSEHMDNDFPELDEIDSDETSPPWHDRTRTYRAVYTRGGRILHLCFIPNTGEWNRYLPLSDLRFTDARKNGTELRLEFSAVTVEIVGRSLARTADDIAIGRVAALEAFDAKRRDPPTEPTNPYIESIRFFAAKQSEPADKKPKATAKHGSSPDGKIYPIRPDAGCPEGEKP
jgi:hypothetical protein